MLLLLSFTHVNTSTRRRQVRSAAYPGIEVCSEPAPCSPLSVLLPARPGDVPVGALNLLGSMF